MPCPPFSGSSPRENLLVSQPTNGRHLPPSRHESCVEYTWKDGLSPDDIDLAEVPQQILDLIAAGNRGDGRDRGKGRKILENIARKGDGDRHDKMLKFAVRLAMRMPRITEEEEGDLWQIISAINLTQCIPPMPMDEVQSLHKYAVSYRAKAESEEIASHGFSTTKIGGDTQVGAGDIKLTIYKSDPIEYRLYVPAWKLFTAGGSGMVTLTAEEYGNHRLMATAVLAQTGEVCLDRYPGYWSNIWSGVAGTEKKKPVIGLKKILVDEATREGRVVVPPPADSRGCELVGWLLERLDTATPADDDDKPGEAGRPTWRADGTLWFSWSRTCEEVTRAHRTTTEDLRDLRRAIVAAIGCDWRHLQAAAAGGIRTYYSVWTREQLEIVRGLAGRGLGAVQAIVAPVLPSKGPRALAANVERPVVVAGLDGLDGVDWSDPF